MPEPWIDGTSVAILRLSNGLRWELTPEILAAYADLEALGRLPAGRQRAAQIALATLPAVAESDPDGASQRWLVAIREFARAIGGLATTNPDQALNGLQTWNANWSMYRVFPQTGYTARFLDGYVAATGIVKNVPFTPGTPATGTPAIGTPATGTPTPGVPNTSTWLYGPVTLTDVQSRLSPSSPMAVYVRFRDPNAQLGTATTYGGFLLSGGTTVKYVDLGPAATIDEAIVAWSNSLRGPDEGSPTGDARQRGRRLYDLLLRPLVGGAPPANLTVVPDGQIGLVSFGALVTPVGQWVLEPTCVSYLGAMRDVAAAAVAKAPATRSRVLFAERFAGQAKLAHPLRTIAALRALDAQLVPLLLTPSAPKTLRGPRYLHIATHGDYAEPKGDAVSAIALASRLYATDAKSDRVITAREVARWDLRGTRLATLAVCDAAKAGSVAGEGTGGLRRALYIAGARQVIASVRRVYAVGRGRDPGDVLIAKVYAGVKRGLAPQESLRQAQRSMLRTKATAAPYLWAGFVCEGPRP